MHIYEVIRALEDLHTVTLADHLFLHKSNYKSLPMHLCVHALMIVAFVEELEVIWHLNISRSIDFGTEYVYL